MIETFQSNGKTLEYEISGEGKPLVFLHGLGGSIQQIYSTYIPIEGTQLIVLNQQGHGGSAIVCDTLTFDQLADDVLALLDHLHLSKVYLAGISMGAAVALNFALRHSSRVEKVMFIRTAWLDGPMDVLQRRAYQDMGKCLIDGSGLEGFKKTIGWEIVKAPSEYTRNAFEIPFRNNEPHPEKYLIMPMQQPVRNLEDIKGLHMPVYIAACRGDLCHPYDYSRALYALLPEADFSELPNKDEDAAGHKDKIHQQLQKMMGTTIV